MEPNHEILANGGVVVRQGGSDRENYLCAVVHRPRYDDWSFPKGKLDHGEEPLEGALREVLEETGYRCRPLKEILSTRYTEPSGRSKIVRYWLMVAAGGEFAPNEEVDAMAWVPFNIAKNVLSYDRDQQVLDSAREALDALDINGQT